MLRQCVGIIWGTLIVSISSGCAAPAPSKTQFSRLPLPLTPQRDVLRTAESVLANVQLNVADRDAETGTLITRSREITGEVKDAPTGTLLSGRRMRQRAEVRAISSGTGSEVYCRVIIEQYRPVARGLSGSEQSLLDTAGDTPIDRGEARTESGDEDWIYNRRDRDLERRILSGIESALGPTLTPGSKPE